MSSAAKIILPIFRDIFMKNSKGIRETIIKAANYLLELEDKQTEINYLETYTRYIFSAYTDITKKLDEL